MKPILTALLVSTIPVFGAEPTTQATTAINALGVDLLREMTLPGTNTLLSPYSIQSALAMTYAGADGDTRAEMARVLHYPEGDAELHRSFAALRETLDGATKTRSKDVERAVGSIGPITLVTANRLFGQSGYEFRQPFLHLVKSDYAAPFEPVDFLKDSSGATKYINDWVVDQTRDRIKNLVPDGALNELTRLVLVNAIYFKAPWAGEFRDSATKPQPFFLGANNVITVPTMMTTRSMGYANYVDFKAVTIPYRGGDFQFLVLLPEKKEGVGDVKKALSARLLDEISRSPHREITLYLPKFKLEPPGVSLSRGLQALGLKSAFDSPVGSANFDRMASRRGNDYLYVSDVFHKTFIDLDEKGTEAAAATAVVMTPSSAVIQKTKPIELHVDRPFLFAIQHRASGACLFVGHLADPR